MNLEFTWKKDKHGYRLKGPILNGESRAAKALLSGNRIVRQGGPLASYVPLKDLHRTVFKDLRTETEALEFTSQYGPISSRPEDSAGEHVDYILRAASTFRRIIARLDTERTMLAGYHAHLKKNRGLSFTNRTLLAETFNNHLRPELTLALKPKPGDSATLIPVLSPKTLLGWMQIQLALELIGDIEFRECEAPGCHNWVMIRHDRASRSTKRTCSDACRVRKHRQTKG